MRFNAQHTPRTLAFVLAGGAGRRLNPLTNYRPKPLVPFGGCFRILDFTLSNCLNSGLDRAYVLTQHGSESMAGYLTRGWTWLGAGRQFAVPVPPALGKRYSGTADALLQNLYLARKQGCKFALVTSADHVYKMDYRALTNFHAANDADVTIAALDYPRHSSSEMGILAVDADNRVIGFVEKPGKDQLDSTQAKTVLVNMGIYVFNVENLLRRAEASDAPLTDIAADLIPLLLDMNRVYAYKHESFRKLPLYWRDVGTLESYYDASMDLLAPSALMDPHDHNWPIRTAGGARLGNRNFLSESGDETGIDSVIPRTASIEGACVYRSVLSSGVVLESGADVRYSVLLPGAVVRRGASVRRAIIDANVVVEAGERIGYNRDRDYSRFHVLPNGIVVVSPDHVAPFFTTDIADKAELSC